MNKKTNLIWIDLEMTGLVPERDVIIEIATVVTDADLKGFSRRALYSNPSERRLS